MLSIGQSLILPERSATRPKKRRSSSPYSEEDINNVHQDEDYSMC